MTASCGECVRCYENHSPASHGNDAGNRSIELDLLFPAAMAGRQQHKANMGTCFTNPVAYRRGFFGTFSTPECLLAFGNILSTATTYETAVIVALCDAQPFSASTRSWSFVSTRGRLLLREQTKSCKRRPARLRNSYSENPTSLVGKKVRPKVANDKVDSAHAVP